MLNVPALFFLIDDLCCHIFLVFRFVRLSENLRDHGSRRLSGTGR